VKDGCSDVTETGVVQGRRLFAGRLNRIVRAELLMWVLYCGESMKA
jgi:hypothetical protein